MERLLYLTVLATLTTQAMGGYTVGMFRASTNDPFKQLSTQQKDDIRRCQYVVDPDDKRLVQHVKFFYWILGEFVWVNSVTPLCSQVPGQVFSYVECSCVYDSNFTVVEQPRAGGGNTTARPPEKCKDIAGLRYDAKQGRYVSNSYASIKGATADLASSTEKAQGGTTSSFALRLDGPIKMQAFAGNDFQGNWRANLRVRPTGTSASPMLLLSDNCDDNPNVKDREQPSMVMAMAGSTLSVNLRFKNGSESTQCTMSRSDWYEIVIESVTTRVTGKVNGNPCFDIPSPGAPLAMTECALFVGGDPLGDTKQNFEGYLDMFKFVKNFDTCLEDKTQ